MEVKHDAHVVRYRVLIGDLTSLIKRHTFGLATERCWELAEKCAHGGRAAVKEGMPKYADYLLMGRLADEWQKECVEALITVAEGNDE